MSAQIIRHQAFILINLTRLPGVAMGTKGASQGSINGISITPRTLLARFMDASIGPLALEASKTRKTVALVAANAVMADAPVLA